MSVGNKHEDKSAHENINIGIIAHYISYTHRLRQYCKLSEDMCPHLLHLRNEEDHDFGLFDACDEPPGDDFGLGTWRWTGIVHASAVFMIGFPRGPGT